MKTVDHVLADIEGILSRAKADCVNQLAAVMTCEPLPGQIFACLELFHMHGFELVYNAFVIEDGKLHTDCACVPGLDGTRSFVPELAAYFRSLIRELAWGEADGHDFTARHEKQFLAWFKDVWLAAGGERAKRPVYFRFEQEDSVHDIMTGAVMSMIDALAGVRGRRRTSQPRGRRSV